MNREIKFRLWNGKDLNYNPIFSRDWTNNINKQLNERINEQGLILQQYTGLKDKNGKEIFEGDIVEQRDRFGREGETQRFTVQWAINGRFFYKSHSDCQYDSLLGIEPTEVIGNIFENPELLK